MTTPFKGFRALRSLATTFPCRQTSTFKDPWDYPASARESMESFRLAKVEFNDPSAKESTESTATESPACTSTAAPTTIKDEAPKACVTKIRLPVPAAEDALKVPIYEGAWELARFSCMPGGYESRLKETICATTVAKN